jgi:hypothetical protein
MEEAIREVIGFYPMKVTYDDDRIFVECTQKEETKVIMISARQPRKSIPLLFDGEEVKE